METLIRLQKEFIDLRFGTFIHFNSATVQFHGNKEIIDWEYDHENSDAPRKFPFSPTDWNPQALDCRQWAAVAKSAGCRFAALTAKHHEGFALWPTAYADHSVKHSANTKDVVSEYLAAFREAGITAGLYFSILDLSAGIGHHSCTQEQKAYIKGQITELLSNYGPIPFLMVDGWGSPWGGPSYDMLPFSELDELVKSLQPECLLLNIGCSDSLKGTDIVFYENAAGQDVEAGFMGPGVSCNKLTDSWFWRDEDPSAKLKDAHWVQKKLQEYFPINCCFMLNLSPDPDGRIDVNQAQAFREIGKIISLPEPLSEIPQGWMVRK